MENKNVTLIIAAFAALLIGVSLIGVIATEEQKVTDLTKILNERIDISGAWTNTTHVNITYPFYASQRYDVSLDRWKIDNSECNMVAKSFGNSSHEFTVTTDYSLTTTGTLTLGASTEASLALRNVRAANNLTYLDYSYCADDYLNAGWNRTVLDLVLGFFAIGLMLVSVGLFYQVLKNEGLANF